MSNHLLCCQYDVDHGLQEEGSDCFFSVVGEIILRNRSSKLAFTLRNITSCANKDAFSYLPLVEYCEVFSPVTEQTLPLMKAHMEQLWGQRLPLCIEVKVQNSRDLGTVLLERWMIEIIAKRQHTSNTTLQLLVHAVESFLHSSQVKAWVSSYTGCTPFDIVCRVCTPAEKNWEQFTLCSAPEEHLFPLATISNCLTLKVLVTYLPCLNGISPPLCGDLNLSLSELKLEDPLMRQADPCLDSQAASNRGNEAYTNGGLSHKPSTVTQSDHTHLQRPLQNSEPQAALFTRCRLQCRQNKSHVAVKVLCGASSEHFEDERRSIVTSAAAECINGLSSSLSLDSPHHVIISPGPHIRGRCRGQIAEEYSALLRTNRRSSFLPMKPPPYQPPQRSISVPAAVPNLCLLGTFEESVLNGRIKPCGHVEGFTAELAASGSFCPRHVLLPVSTSFFDLSKDVGTSPYMGYIDLSEVGKKGYHVPSKGTIQVTLFNPNKTVVKIFIVPHDLSSMPAGTQTFLRQRTVSKFAASHSSVLHYLIHLRFASSQSGRVYVHTDIRLIFARRAPDNDPDMSKVTLFTTLEGPTDPKYSPWS